MAATLMYRFHEISEQIDCTNSASAIAFDSTSDGSCIEFRMDASELDLAPALTNVAVGLTIWGLKALTTAFMRWLEGATDQ